MTLSYTYAQAEGIAENTSATLFEVYEADTTGELDEADIVASTPTLAKSATGDLTYTPLTDGKYIRIRVRSFTSDSEAAGSQWYYTSVVGPVAASASYSPLDFPGTVAWYDMSQTNGGEQGGAAIGKWERIYNKADGTGESDMVQTNASNQFDVSNLLTDRAISGDASGVSRMRGTQMATNKELVAANTIRTMYIVTKLTAGGDYISLAGIGGNTCNFNTDTENNIRGVTSTFETGNDSIPSSGWVCVKFGIDEEAPADNRSFIEILENQGALGTPVRIERSAGDFFNGAVNGASDNAIRWRARNEAKIRHVVITDGSISRTAHERTELETFLISEAS